MKHQKKSPPRRHFFLFIILFNSMYVKTFSVVTFQPSGLKSKRRNFSSWLFHFFSPPLPFPYPHPDYFLLYAKKQLFTSVSYFSKTASPWCSWFGLTVTECRSRWTVPSIQAAAIVIFKRADICWRAERGSFQRDDESPVLDCSERGPRERMRTWQEGWKGERKRFQTTIPLSFSISFYPSH